MIDVLRVGHATFTTPDLERQVAYYSDVLGLIVTECDKNRAFLATRTGLEAIALERGDKPELTRLSFQVAADADFAAYARELSEHGIKSEQRNGISPGAARALPEPLRHRLLDFPRQALVWFRGHDIRGHAGETQRKEHQQFGHCTTLPFLRWAGTRGSEDGACSASRASSSQPKSRLIKA
jgi:catechol 2,3-dioxygenase-like lactoylglutathione lyase family enzyme